MRATLPLFAVLLAGSCVAAAGEIYRWRDSAGAWHYGDKPPTGSNAEWYDPRPRAGIDRQARPEAPPPVPDAGSGAPPKPVSGPR